MKKITKRDIKNTLKKMLVVPENPLLEGALALLKKLECELAEVDEKGNDIEDEAVIEELRSRYSFEVDEIPFEELTDYLETASRKRRAGRFYALDWGRAVEVLAEF